MRLFKITNPKFKGDVDVVYNENDSINKIDFTNAAIPNDVLTAFKRALPVTLDVFLKREWCGADTMVVEADYEVSFAMFWNAYDKKINRKRAEIVFDHLPKIKKVKALLAIKGYDKFLKSEGWRAKADPETYLRNEMWENEYK